MKSCFALLALTLVWSACAEEPGGFSRTARVAQLSQERVWTRLHTRTPAKLSGALLAEGVDVTGSHHRQGFVDILTSPTERDRLVAKHADRIQHTTRLAMEDSERALSDYHDPDEISAMLDQIQADHPSIARKVTLRQGLPEGGVIHAMKISDNVQIDEDEPVYMMDGQTHAREVMTAEVMIDALEYLTTNYGINPQVTRWVDELEIWIVPVVNPDGAHHVHASDPWWRKNRSHECGGDVGVDLNRNFEWNYRQCPGSDDDCGSDVYHGPGAASEFETQAIQDLLAELRPMYYINYHSYGEYIVYPSACERVDEDAFLRQVAEGMNAVLQDDSGQTNRYVVGTAVDTVGYTAPGGADDHAYGAVGALGFTLEINSGGFQPDYASYRDLTCQRQRAAWGYLLNLTLDGPAVTGRTYDAGTLGPVVASYTFANHPFGSGQWALTTDSAGRYGRAVPANSDHVLVFTASGYLPETRVIQVGATPIATDVPMTPGLNHAPLANAGQDRTVAEGDTVVLDASDSSDPDGNTLFFQWSQVAGPSVWMQNAWTATPSFFAPAVSSDQTVVFEVTAHDGELSSPPDSVTITIRNMWDDTSVHGSTDTPIVIPDDIPAGIVSVINVPVNRPVLKASAHVDITHTYIGDLFVRLTSPAGTQVVLHDQEGGSTDDLHADYEPPEFIGELSGGDWVLFGADLAGSDTGSLDGWSLALELVGDPPCQSAGDCDLPHVDQPDCIAGRCEIISCATGWSDCDSSPNNGCEIDLLTDPAHCGACGTTCTFAHAAATCQAGGCVMGACNAPWADCNALPNDGCEVDPRSDPQHCGGCDQTCALDNATASCLAGSCAIAACDSLWGNCDGLIATGCEADVSSDPANCGACSLACQLAQADAVCAQGACQISTCQGTWADCDEQDRTGCERELATDVEHCGACGYSCHALNAEVDCQAGTCVTGACLDGFGDCNQDAGDGCEADLADDPAHCGACGLSCDLANAVADCLLSECLISRCADGFGNCNQLVADGCEADLLADPAHCGACDRTCALAHATAGCQAGACTLAACDPAFGDCNADPQDGCETYLSTNVDHCGACGEVCAPPHATASCRQGGCTLSECDPGFGNCNRDPVDGCEIEYANDPDHCGGCGRACAFANAHGLCSSGQCELGDCLAGAADCNAQNADGCEIDLSSDDANCGVCGHACPDGENCQDSTCAEPCPDQDNDGFSDDACGGQDCDDSNSSVAPGAAEICNGLDDDCNGLADDGIECASTGCGCSASSPPGGLALGWLVLLALLAIRRARARK